MCVTTRGDDDQHPPRPPDPFQTPFDGHVDHPRFGDGGTDDYAPDYGGERRAADPTATGPGQPPPPPAPSPPAPPAPSPDAGVHTPPQPVPSGPVPLAASKRSDSRRGLIAPIAAAVVLIGGIGLLIWTSDSDEPDVTTAPRIAEVGDPDEPVVQSTVPGGSVADSTTPEVSVEAGSVPMMTSPPLVEPTATAAEVVDTIPTDTTPTDTTPTDTTPTDTTPTDTTTATPGAGGPSQAQLDGALLGIDDIGSGDWSEEEPDFDEICDTVPDLAAPVARADSVFGTVLADTFEIRQVSNTLVTYETAEIAEQVFTSDVEEIIACDAQTIDLEGQQFRVRVDNDSFPEETLQAFPCADQSSFLIIQLVNDGGLVPYIGQASVTFRCGRNITVTALGTTIGLDDLDDDDFYNAAAISNTRTGALPGS